MNFEVISLSSFSTNETYITNELNFIDHTSCTILLSNFSENILPSNLSIDWGDGIVEYFENNILQNFNINSGIYSSLLLDSYKHEYFPLESASEDVFFITIRCDYVNNDKLTFYIPIRQTNSDWNETIEDIKLVDTIINNNNNKIYKISTKKDGYLLEITTEGSYIPEIRTLISTPDIEIPEWTDLESFEEWADAYTVYSILNYE